MQYLSYPPDNWYPPNRMCPKSFTDFMFQWIGKKVRAIHINPSILSLFKLFVNSLYRQLLAKYVYQ